MLNSLCLSLANLFNKSKFTQMMLLLSKLYQAGDLGEKSEAGFLKANISVGSRGGSQSRGWRQGCVF